MSDKNYKADSNVKDIPKDKPELKKIVEGNVSKKKTSFTGKIVDNIFSEDIRDVKSYLFWDVFIPGVKNFCWSMLSSTVDSMFGKTGVKAISNFSGNVRSKVNYHGVSSNTSISRETRPLNAFDFDNITFEDYGEAQMVLDTMIAIINEYQLVKVSDLYDLAGITWPYTYENYGWTNLDRASINRSRNGEYVIVFPKAVAIR